MSDDFVSIDRQTLAFALGLQCHGHKNRTDQAMDKQNAIDKVRRIMEAPTPLGVERFKWKNWGMASHQSGEFIRAQDVAGELTRLHQRVQELAGESLRVLSGGRRNGKSHLAQQLESLAKQVYDSWQSQPGWVPWQDGMYGSKQAEARQIASRVFELALANQVGD